MRILALDLATRTGWALWDGARLESGVQDFSKQRGESNGMLFWKFNKWLADIALNDDHPIVSCRSDRRIDLIVFEQAHHRGGAATEICVGLVTRVQEMCARFGIDHSPIHGSTLKKWATGHGNADKKAMIEAAEVRLYDLNRLSGRPTITDDNEADAILLLGYALEKFGGETSWNARPAAAGKTESPKLPTGTSHISDT